VSDLLRILAAPVAWLAAFSAVYGLHGILCEAGPAGTLLGLPAKSALLGLAFGLAVLLQLALLALLHAPRFDPGPGFTRTLSRAGGWVGLVATLWTLFPTLATSTCG